MADLNPSHDDTGDKATFEACLAAAAPAQFEAARAQGDRYFFIPALGRHRGVTHFYLEDYATDDFEADRALAYGFARAAIDAYAGFLARPGVATDAARGRQLAYHTLYLFQVLTLDRGTTSGLLIHDQNDLGIMGSLPSWVDRALLASWAHRVPSPQDELVRALVAALPASDPCPVTDDVRLALAQAVRAHYRAHPRRAGAAGERRQDSTDGGQPRIGPMNGRAAAIQLVAVQGPVGVSCEGKKIFVDMS